MEPSPASRAVQSLVELIQTFADTRILKSEIERLSKTDIEAYHDSNDLDVLHHAIIANNIEAVTILFFKGYFLPPHEYHSLSYTHLAARLGHRTILGSLLQDRPHDNKAVAFKYNASNQKQYQLAKDSDERIEVTPLDVAGKSGHIGCVKLILDHYLGRNLGAGRFSGKDTHINMACKLDSPFALRLLLTQSASDDDLKSAVGAALKHAKPECLDILLRLRPDLSSLFGGMNLYHVLYSYSLSFDRKWIEALPAVTAVLIRHGHSVLASVPFRTYPLYSLLYLYVKCYDMTETLPFIMACLVLLLNAGADPNFDEVDFEVVFEKLDVQTAFGRLAYSSGIHCLYSSICCLNIHLDDENGKGVGDMIQQCTEMLLRHRANLNMIGRVTEDGSLMGTAFHFFCNMSIVIGLEERTLSLLLKYGADPDIEWAGIYPLSLICEKFICTSVEKLTEKDLNVLLKISDMMSRKAVIELIESINSYKVESSSIQDKYKQTILHYLEDVVSHHTLKRLCQYSILKYCRRHVARVLKLPIPMPLKTEIVEPVLSIMS